MSGFRGYGFQSPLRLISLLLALLSPTIASGQIEDKYQSLGGPSGFLGNPVEPENQTPDGIGKFRYYEHGSIYWSPLSGAHEVHGAIWEKWRDLRWEQGWLGYPTTDETAAADNRVRFNHFQGGSIFWTADDGATALNIGDKFNEARRNDRSWWTGSCCKTMADHLKMYKDKVTIFGIAIEPPHVNFPNNISRDYEQFICAQWWFSHGNPVETEDPPDGDLDFRLIVDPHTFESQSDFWTTGWVFGHKTLWGSFIRNGPEAIQQKLEDGRDTLRVEAIMYGRSAECDEDDSSFPLLPGWAELGVSSVMLNGEPIDCQVDIGGPIHETGHTGIIEAWSVNNIKGKQIVPFTMVRVTGFLALDCHGSDCQEDDRTAHNVEIHPAYSIDILGMVPCLGDRKELSKLQGESHLLKISEPTRGPNVAKRWEEWKERSDNWHSLNDGKIAELETRLARPECQITWP